MDENTGDKMRASRGLSNGVAIGAVLCLGLAFSGDALAQAANADCRADAAKFCAQVQPGAGRVAQCLKESQWQISAACREHAEAVARRTSETLQACRDEALLYCSSAEIDAGGISQCLNRAKGPLSAECSALVKLLQKK